MFRILYSVFNVTINMYKLMQTRLPKGVENRGASLSLRRPREQGPVPSGNPLAQRLPHVEGGDPPSWSGF